MEPRKIDILFLSQGSDFYGSNRVMLEAAKHLAEHGYALKVIFPNKGPILEEFGKLGIPHVVLNLGILRRKYVHFFGLVNRGYFFLKALINLILLIKRHQVTLVYSNGLGVLVGYLASKLAGAKHVWHIHEIIKAPNYFYFFYRTVLNLDSSHKTAVSEAVRSFWNKKPGEHFTRIYNGFTSVGILENSQRIREELNIPPETLVIGMVGRVNYLKGQEYFIKIANELLHFNPKLLFVMVGDPYPGNEYLVEELNSFKKTLEITDSILDLGYRQDVPAILAALDLFILPSILPDSFPTVILEAMGQSKAIVSTAQGGALEMLEDSISGIFIPISKEKEAKDLIIPLLLDKNLRMAMGKAARRKVLTDFSAEAFKSNLIEKINSICLSN